MADIEKIIDNLNLPKQILDKSEALLKTLFGQAFDELGGMIADQVRLRRFKNQIKIFARAQEILKEKKIDPKKVSLKVLAPLIEYSSYEEEPSLQERWSSLTAYILETDEDLLFQQNCISILNKISAKEANLLDALFKRVESDGDRKSGQQVIPPLNSGGIPLSTNVFETHKICNELNEELDALNLKISNLISLDLLRWMVEVKVRNSHRRDFPFVAGVLTDRVRGNSQIQLNTYNDQKFAFTLIGYKFMEVCKTSSNSRPSKNP
jgi:hypothetical protein